MDFSFLIPLFFIAVVAFMVGGFLKQSHQRATAWSAMAEPLGLRLAGSVLVGELDGVSVRIGMETHQVGSEGLVQFCVVRAKVPGAMPAGFVAAPRRWTSGLSRMLSSNLFTSGDPALDEQYIFQCDNEEAGKVFVAEAPTREALRSLIGPYQTGFVEKGRAGIATMGLITEVEEARRKLEAVTRAAQLLAGAHARLAAAPSHRAEG